MKWIIIDNNGIEDDLVVESMQEVRNFVTETLEYYYEAVSPVGTVIADIMEYIPDENLEHILTDYNYTIIKEK